MKKLKITVALLARFNACHGAQERLQERGEFFVTDDQEENFAILSKFVDSERSLALGDVYSHAERTNENAHAHDAWWFADEIFARDGSRAEIYEISRRSDQNEFSLWNACGVLADAVGVYLARKR